MSVSLHNHSDLEYIEIDLTPEQTEVWVQAAARSLGSNEPVSKPARTGRVGMLVRVLLYVGMLVGIAYVRQVGEEPIRVAQKVDPEATGVVQEPAATVPSDSEGLLVTNPFDRTETFRFPPGTSKAEAREAVTQLLMERAHDRLPLLAEASRRRGAAVKHGTRESSQVQDSPSRSSQGGAGERT